MYICMIAITLAGCAHTFSDSESKGMPEFESLVGSGTLEIIGVGVEARRTEAWATVSDNETIPNRKGCKVLMLKSTGELVMKIAPVQIHKNILFVVEMILNAL